MGFLVGESIESTTISGQAQYEEQVEQLKIDLELRRKVGYCGVLAPKMLWCLFPYGAGSKPIVINLSGMKIYLLAIWRFTRYQGFDP